MYIYHKSVGKIKISRRCAKTQEELSDERVKEIKI